MYIVLFRIRFARPVLILENNIRSLNEIKLIILQFTRSVRIGYVGSVRRILCARKIIHRLVLASTSNIKFHLYAS